MGTSKGYAAPTGGHWTKLKQDVSRLARDPDLMSGSSGASDPRIGSILAQLVAALGGVSAIAGSTRAPTGGGGTTPGILGAAAAQAGAGIGGFASTVAESGLNAALRRLDLDDLIERPADEVADAIVERLSGVPAGLDDAAAREAVILLLDELRGDAANLDDMEHAYRRAMEAYGLRGLLVRYFGYYLYVLFCERFAERLNRDPDHSDTGTVVTAQVRDYILTALESRLEGEDTSQVDWTGSDGLAISEEILKETLEVFAPNPGT